ncbi:MAG TPA: HD domain-containing phosphohydrolase [Rhodocyclaceae bacterium]|nr:HD domain-containing phosphohydrolase [Rhodocyclaceae bacterium]
MAANDPTALTQPRIIDRDSFGDFFDSLIDKLPTIERDVARLRREPHDTNIIADLFRAMHNIKGDAAICKVEMGVLLAHPVENLLSRVRAGTLEFSDILAEIILLTLDRLEMATEALSRNQPIANLKLDVLAKGLNELSDAQGAALDRGAEQVIEAVTGFRPKLANAQVKPHTTTDRKERAEDLAFFRKLALQLETHSSHYEGRTGRIVRLALETNAAAGRPVDPVQLEAAVYMHDVGMMFLPESIWLQSGKMNDADREVLRTHPALAAGILQRMAGWDEAARMVAQHHEMPDGGGYPVGRKAKDIVPGAKIIAIVDAFEAVTLKQSHRGTNRSLLRAIAEINACDNQFDAAWIGHFNNVIRAMA